MDAGYSVILLYVGRPRTGKSWVGLSTACVFDPKFRTEPIMYFSIKTFAIEILNRIINKNFFFEYKVFLIDEVGKDLDFRVYSSLFNRTFSYILQTQQIVNKLFILCLPHAKLLAKAHHYLINYVARCSRARGKVVVYEITTDYADLEGKSIFRSKLETIHNFPTPPQNVIEWFDKFERERKQDMGAEILKEMSAKELKEEHIDAQQKALDNLFNKLGIKDGGT